MAVDNKAVEYSTKAVYLRLLAYSKNYRLAFYFAIVGMVITAGANAFFVKQVEPLVEQVFTQQDPNAVWTVPMLIILAVSLRALGGIMGSYGMDYVAMSVIRDIRKQLFSKYLNVPSSMHDRSSSGEALSKVTYNVGLLSHTCSKSITILIRDGLTGVGLIFIMCTISAKLVLVFLVIFPVMLLLVGLGNKAVRRYSKRIQDSVGNVAQVVSEIITAHRIIKVFGGHKTEQQRFGKVNDYTRSQELKLAVINSLVSPFVQILVGISLGLIIYVAATGMFIEAPMKAGEFMAFFFAFAGLFAPLRSLTKVNLQIQRGVAAAQSVFDIIDSESELDEGQATIEKARGNLDFLGVGFSYQGAETAAINNLNLSIKAGQTVALVGASGSGKTTLASLLPRFYDVDNGAIKLDDHNIQDYSLSDLRRQISYVGQDIRLFDDSIRNNIAYGEMEGFSDTQIRQAAIAARAIDFIEAKPEGFNALVGEGGAQLSGGQRQRISIARALLKDSPILILDEATSALDTESERHIQAALDELVKNRTTLMIAHRLSTIEKADLIVVMEQGRIIEQGSHTELLTKQGAYSQLHKMQFSEH